MPTGVLSQQTQIQRKVQEILSLRFGLRDLNKKNKKSIKNQSQHNKHHGELNKNISTLPTQLMNFKKSDIIIKLLSFANKNRLESINIFINDIKDNPEIAEYLDKDKIDLIIVGLSHEQENVVNGTEKLLGYIKNKPEIAEYLDKDKIDLIIGGLSHEQENVVNGTEKLLGYIKEKPEIAEYLDKDKIDLIIDGLSINNLVNGTKKLLGDIKEKPEMAQYLDSDKIDMIIVILSNQVCIEGTQKLLGYIKDKPEIAQYLDKDKIKRIILGLSDEVYIKGTEKFLGYIKEKPEIAQYLDEDKIKMIIEGLLDGRAIICNVTRKLLDIAKENHKIFDGFGHNNIYDMYEYISTKLNDNPSSSNSKSLEEFVLKKLRILEMSSKDLPVASDNLKNTIASNERCSLSLNTLEECKEPVILVGNNTKNFLFDFKDFKIWSCQNVCNENFKNPSTNEVLKKTDVFYPTNETQRILFRYPKP